MTTKPSRMQAVGTIDPNSYHGRQHDYLGRCPMCQHLAPDSAFSCDDLCCQPVTEGSEQVSYKYDAPQGAQTFRPVDAAPLTPATRVGGKEAGTTEEPAQDCKCGHPYNRHTSYGYCMENIDAATCPCKSYAPISGRASEESALLMERIAQITAHRSCCGAEHDPTNGRLHGYCIVCGVPWPCGYAGTPPAKLGDRGESVEQEKVSACEFGVSEPTRVIRYRRIVELEKELADLQARYDQMRRLQELNELQWMKQYSAIQAERDRLAESHRELLAAIKGMHEPPSRKEMKRVTAAIAKAEEINKL